MPKKDAVIFVTLKIEILKTKFRYVVMVTCNMLPVGEL